jgi:spore germination cell wall hydrolase CwlJ-like protein
MTENDLTVLAQTMWGEARGEIEEGKKAIANVVFNRFNAKKWFSGDTISKTCQFPWQFSCWNKDDPNREKMLKLSYMQLKPYFELIKESMDEGDNTNGATHYYAPKVVKAPKWSIGKKPCAEIGNHLFFKEVD